MTSNPWVDNANRNYQRWLERTARKAFKIKSNTGRITRKRKKYMYSVERQAYKELLHSVTQHLIRKEQS